MRPDNLTTEHRHPDYDLHMPRVISYPIPISIISILAGILAYVLLRESRPALSVISTVVVILAGGIYVGIYIFLKRITNLDRRLEARDKFLNEIPWNGDENVLDVGCGNGILLLGAAKRFPNGKGVGIDLWTEGSGDNRREVFLENAKIEGVADRVVLQNEDARQLPFEDETFDVIISGLTIHHLRAEANKAIREMTRVLKPGGWMAIYDEPSTIMYCRKLMRDNALDIEMKTADMIYGTKTRIKKLNNSSLMAEKSPKE